MVIVSLVIGGATHRWMPRGWIGRFRRLIPAGTHLILLAFVVPFLIRLSLLPFLPPPEPSIPDEFSYLLLAKTLAAGRLANPPHPLWEHFETLFVNQRPAYASVYPVAQGLILALGLAVGHPWIGVLASVAAMCGAITWMLLGYFPRRWAAVGGGLVVIQMSLAGPWINTYWGGAVASTGGALALGALARLRSRAPATRHALVFAAGLAILANSRPYEGFLLAVGLLPFLRPLLQPKAFFSAAGGLILTAAFMGYYFWRTTGDPLRLPHQTYIAEYAAAPVFLWQQAPPTPRYRHDLLRAAHTAMRTEYEQARQSPARTAAVRIAAMSSFFLGPLGWLLLIGIPATLRDPRRRPLLAVSLTVLAGLCLTAPFQFHYGAPAAAAVVGLGVQALRFLWSLRRAGVSFGWVLAPAIPLLCVAHVVQVSRLMPPDALAGLPGRSSLIERLTREPGSHLVIVQYGPVHQVGREWVYNDPDIDHARVVWARQMNPAKDRALTGYYPDRTAWLWEPEVTPGGRLTRYQP